MPKTSRQRIEPTNDWAQLQLLSRSLEQRTYELPRPVRPFAVHARLGTGQTGAPERTLYR